MQLHPCQFEDLGSLTQMPLHSPLHSKKDVATHVPHCTQHLDVIWAAA